MEDIALIKGDALLSFPNLSKKFLL